MFVLGGGKELPLRGTYCLIFVEPRRRVQCDCFRSLGKAIHHTCMRTVQLEACFKSSREGFGNCKHRHGICINHSDLAIIPLIALELNPDHEGSALGISLFVGVNPLSAMPRHANELYTRVVGSRIFLREYLLVPFLATYDLR